MKNKTPIICARCGKEFDGGGWDEITYHKCVKQIRTNADRIRAMSDEGLAKVVDWDVMTEMGWKDESLLDWLKQEVE